MQPIRIALGGLSLAGELNDTEYGRALAQALPLTAEFTVWGDEIRFDAPVEGDLRGRPAPAVKVGDLGYWPDDGTLCVFFGPTPMSDGEDPVSAVPVTVVGHIESAESLRTAKEAGEITVLRVAGPEAHVDD